MKVELASGWDGKYWLLRLNDEIPRYITFTEEELVMLKSILDSITLPTEVRK